MTDDDCDYTTRLKLRNLKCFRKIFVVSVCCKNIFSSRLLSAQKDWADEHKRAFKNNSFRLFRVINSSDLAQSINDLVIIFELIKFSACYFFADLFREKRRNRRFVKNTV